MTRSLAALRQGVLRPRDASDFYTQPGHRFQYWQEAGVLLQVAHGYYALIPEANRGAGWRPEIEALALALGQADYGRNEVALMHLSAARIHGAIPRALAIAVLAVPKQRPALETTCGRIVFVKRDVSNLKRVRIDTELASGWATSLEQTALDLARRPDLVSGLSKIAHEAVAALLPRCNEKKLELLAKEQRMTATLVRAKRWINNA